MGERHLGDALDLLCGRHVLPVDAFLRVELFHFGIRGETPVYKSRGMAQKVLDGDLAVGGNVRIFHGTG